MEILINLFILRKGVYPYEYMDNWERFNETSLPDKEYFYSSLNMENIDDTDYRHVNNVFKKFKLKNLGEYTIYTFKATRYDLQMYLKTLEICALKCMSLILLISYHYQD